MDFADTRTSLAGLGLVTGTAASTVSADAASVTIGGITVTCSVLKGLTLAVGDTVLVARQGSNRWVIGLTKTTAPATVGDTDTSPTPKPPVVTGTLVCAPVETRSYRDGHWRSDSDDTLQGVYGGYGNSTGCAFYGTKPGSLSGAMVTAATIRVERERAGTFSAQTSTLWLVTQSTKPSGAPSLTSSTTGPRLAVGGTNNSFAIPISWAQAMVDGTAGGLAVFDSSGSPYIRFAGRNSWSAAWVMTLTWRR